MNELNEPICEYKFLDENKEHLHTFAGRPLLGTTTVVGVLSKNLTWWASELSAVECLESGEHIPTIREEYLKAKEKGKIGIDELQKKYPIFKQARFAHFNDKNAKAEKGTDMHAMFEEYVKHCMYNNNRKPVSIYKTLEVESDNNKLQKFIKWSVENVDEFLFSENNVFSTELWVGGQFDVIFKMKNGKICLGDFKSSPVAYQNQFIQIAGYDIQQSENGIFTNNGYKVSKPIKIDCYCVFPFGSEKLEVDFRYNLDELKGGFKSCVVLHKLIN